MFRRRPVEQLDETAKAERHSERLQALGELIDERRFTLDGICILASGDGYIVTGYALVTDSLETRLGQHTLEVTGEMLAAAITRRRVGR